MSLIELIQKRIANTSAGTSALRGQPGGTIEAARTFFKNIDLGKFRDVRTETEFLIILNEQTDLLKDKLPSQRWGPARKAMNIFLFESAHNIYLSEKFLLINIIPYLELPLDNPNAKRLIRKAKLRDINIYWDNITNLTKEDSDKLQYFAKKLSQEEYNCDRCHLDLYFWRSDN